MRAGYETTVFELDQSGVARYSRGLLEALRAEVEVVELAQPARGPKGRIARGLLRELAWFPAGLDQVAERAGVDVLHCPGQVGPPLATRVPLVVTIFDLMALEHPEWFTRANALQVRAVWPRMLRNSAAIIVAATFTRDRLLERFPRVAPERVHVIPCGLDARFTPGTGPDDERPYILTVGRLQPRKNLEGALAAFERLSATHPDVRLVVVGARGWHDGALYERLRSDRIEVTGHVSEAELVRLYQGASCFLFPSLYEGFGFPPLEAMACGAPVVCSDVTTLPEVVGDAGLLVDARDPDAIAAALSDVLSDPAVASDLRRRGLERAQRFTWARCAAATAAVYASVT